MNRIYTHQGNLSSNLKEYRIIDSKISTLSPGVEFRNTDFKKKLERSRKIIFHFEFKKIGDSLLALFGAKAFIDFIFLSKNITIEKIYIGKNFDLLDKLSLYNGFRSGSIEEIDKESFVISDSKDVCGDYNFVPEIVFAYKNIFSEFIYSALPHRYYFDIQEKLGVRLFDPIDTTEKFCMPDAILKYSDKDSYKVGIVSCTSLIDRKAYPYFIGFTESLQCNTDKNIVFYWFMGGEGKNLGVNRVKNLEIEKVEVHNGNLSQIANFFSDLDLVIGNDTGLTHLSALTRKKKEFSKTISLYNRHSYFKWNTGMQNHICIATPFSHIIGVSDKCPIRDNLDERNWPNLSGFDNISSNFLTEISIRYLI